MSCTCIKLQVVFVTVAGTINGSAMWRAQTPTLTWLLLSNGASSQIRLQQPRRCLYLMLIAWLAPC